MPFDNSSVTKILMFGCRFKMDSATAIMPKLISYELLMLILFVWQCMTTELNNVGSIA